jgi:hypothetical protein
LCCDNSRSFARRWAPARGARASARSSRPVSRAAVRTGWIADELHQSGQEHLLSPFWRRHQGRNLRSRPSVVVTQLVRRKNAAGATHAGGRGADDRRVDIAGAWLRGDHRLVPFAVALRPLVVGLLGHAKAVDLDAVGIWPFRISFPFVLVLDWRNDHRVAPCRNRGKRSRWTDIASSWICKVRLLRCDGPMSNLSNGPSVAVDRI